MRAGEFGLMLNPNMGNTLHREPGVTWAADNGCFSARWDADKWWAWLERNAVHADSCLFAVAPDAVGDAAQTLAMSAPWMPRIRALGYRVAFVAQDGLETLADLIPWDAFDCLFIGGSTEWKLSDHARKLTAEAKQRGKWVHMGRVNSAQRMQLAAWWGVDSCDGTFLAFGPDVNLPRLRAMIRQAREPVLFDASA